MDVESRIGYVAQNLRESGIPPEFSDTIMGRVTTFFEMYQAGEQGPLLQTLQDEVVELSEDLAVAVNCLLVLESGWELMARRVAVNEAALATYGIRSRLLQQEEVDDADR